MTRASQDRANTIAPVEDQRDPSQKAGQRAHASTRRGRLWVAVVLLLLFTGAALGSYLAWHRFAEAVQELRNEVAVQEGARRDAEKRLHSLESGLSAQQRTLDAQQSQLDAQRQGLSRQKEWITDSVQALRRQGDMKREDWVVAEAEFLLRIANHRLRLEGDKSTAGAALEMADRRLRELGDPTFFQVREILAGEMTALKGAQEPDIPGIALTLSRLSQQVDSIPVRGERPTQPAVEATPATAPKGTTDGWPAALQHAWDGFRGLVVVRHREQRPTLALGPAERFFLKENLRLKLETARLALLIPDPDLYRDSLQTASHWIDRHFDGETNMGRGVLSQINDLAQREIRPEFPDISGSFMALQSLAMTETGGATTPDSPTQEEPQP